MQTKHYDVIVVGGGPAGSTAATLIAQRGRSVVLFERERFPRYHVGESLIPETYWVLRRLNMLNRMRRSGFVQKHSVQFVSATGRVSAPFYFHDNKPHECSQTWQVVRSEFDQMLLDNAREHGVVVREGAHVLEVLFEGFRACGVSVRNGEQYNVRGTVVVDASGQAALLQNRFGLRVWDPVLRKGAIWTYWRGAYRDTGRDEGTTMVLQTADKTGWFWYIPLQNDVISVGLVAPYDDILKNRKGLSQTYEDAVAACAAVRTRLDRASRIAGFHATRDYSYRSREIAGNGWVLVGDAFGFLDPLYSSGVLLALRSGEMAADAICDGFECGDLSARQLGRWGEDFGAGVDRMRRLVCEYYEGFSFGKFVRQYPGLRNTVTDVLIGDVFTARVDALWQPMDSLRHDGVPPVPAWNATLAAAASGREHELVLPANRLEVG